ncbi:hypothetical protein CERSUDRAFT_91084 [Gelatoporia subvermispora B]|uniref:DUF7918 domain-containing protein n=1 Tax=Ceriporiopsis subvermispora (strain B) TaxID=914234 RepID=M2RPJ2_CERS8|nr:hypothetical protein CERSUDRAFT_91084 [Gelatoporia subvermispora B]
MGSPALSPAQRIELVIVDREQPPEREQSSTHLLFRRPTLPPSMAALFTFYIGERNSLDTTVALDCYIDGQHMGGMLCDPGEYTLDEGLRVGLGRLRTYKFVPVETYDDIPTIAQHPHPDQVGTIEIRAFRARTCYPTRITRTNQFPATYQVHEATKLGAMHCVSVGHELDVDVEETDADLIDPLDNPYAIFKIFYRPIGATNAPHLTSRIQN